MEILVSLVILSLVFLGLLNLFISGRKYLQHSQSRMTAVELGKLFIDPLQMEVRTSDWWWESGDPTVNQLTPTAETGSPITSSQSISSIIYTATSEISELGALRRVQTKIVWQEKQ